MQLFRIMLRSEMYCGNELQIIHRLYSNAIHKSFWHQLFVKVKIVCDYAQG